MKVESFGDLIVIDLIEANKRNVAIPRSYPPSIIIRLKFISLYNSQT